MNAQELNLQHAELPIELLDDLEIEELEWLSLRLESEHQGVGYELRDGFAHTVQIADNDAVWDGSFVSENEQIAFSMEILRQAGAVEASLRAHTGGLLAEVDPVAAPVTIQFTDVLFNAQTSAIPIPGSRTPSGSAMEIELSLHATPSTGLVSDTQVIGDTDMGSTTTLVLRTPGHPHLERTLAGSFALTRRAPRPNTTPPPLVSLGLAGDQ